MVITKEVKAKWCPTNRGHLESKGYKFTKYGDETFVKFEDMSHGSGAMIEVECDYCQKRFERRISKYYRHGSAPDRDCCVDCSPIKTKETKLQKYGNLNFYCSEKAQLQYRQKRDKIEKQYYDRVVQECNKRNYALISKEYHNNYEHLEYICNKHEDYGIQKISWGNLNAGYGCRLCGYESCSKTKTKTFDEVKSIIESSGKHKLISTEYHGADSYDLEITCEECDNTFVTSLSCFMGGRHLCSECNCSSGERAVIDYLRSNGIKYSHEHKIYIGGNENPYRFDFYLEKYNLVIEYDGEQHYEPINFNSETQEIVERNFRRGQRRDELKDEYCKENNISLMRIPYWEKENIPSILDDFFQNNSRNFIVATDYLEKHK